ncbi:MAG: transcription repressor NadR [Limnochordaceae bacterium]|nr:transcription repressor NadR [Limnochordaceae bacterium]
MQNEERRQRLVHRLQLAGKPLTGGELAAAFGVTRQVIVQDVAVLRAGGLPVVATPRGYLWIGGQIAAHRFRDVLAVRHGPDLTRAELMALVHSGCRVVDVLVEHPLYGELRGELQLATPADVEDFLQRTQEGKQGLLSSLTGGVHYHTVEAAQAEAIGRARECLRELGILLENP